jgi:hypothetical protein
VRVICSAKVYLLWVYHYQNLPRLSISWDSSVYWTSVFIMKFSMMNFLGSPQNWVAHLEVFFWIVQMIKQCHPIFPLFERELLFNFLVKKLGNHWIIILENLPPLLYILKRLKNINIVLIFRTVINIGVQLSVCRCKVIKSKDFRFALSFEIILYSWIFILLLISINHHNTFILSLLLTFSLRFPFSKNFLNFVF